MYISYLDNIRSMPINEHQKILMTNLYIEKIDQICNSIKEQIDHTTIFKDSTKKNRSYEFDNIIYNILYIREFNFDENMDLIQFANKFSIHSSMKLAKFMEFIM